MNPDFSTGCTEDADCANTAELQGEYGGDFGPWTCAELTDPDTDAKRGSFCSPLTFCETNRLTDMSVFPDQISLVTCSSACDNNEACRGCLGLGAGEVCLEHLKAEAPETEVMAPTTLPPLSADADNVVFAGWSGGSRMAH
jgi:hypothetical protein